VINTNESRVRISDSPQNYDFSLEEKENDIHLTQFPKLRRTQNFGWALREISLISEGKV
jgi:hypothetical protein